MKASRLIAALVATLTTMTATSTAHADTTFSEGFDDFASIASRGWEVWNLSPQAAGVGGWFQGNPGIFEAAQGPASSYAAANYLAVDGGPISLWLVTPAIELHGADVLNFSFRSEGVPGFADGLRVHVGSGSATAPGDFSQMIFEFTAAPPVWIEISPQLPQLGDSVRIAFEYFGDFETAAYLGLDSISVTTPVPEPGAAALLALGLAGIALQRRRRTSGLDAAFN